MRRKRGMRKWRKKQRRTELTGNEKGKGIAPRPSRHTHIQFVVGAFLLRAAAVSQQADRVCLPPEKKKERKPRFLENE